MSFEQANQIIMEVISKHYEKSLEQYYLKARSKFEENYSKIN